MKRNTLHLGASILATMILAACSGGGGGGSNPPAEQQVKPVQPAVPAQPNTPATQPAGKAEQNNQKDMSSKNPPAEEDKNDPKDNSANKPDEKEKPKVDEPKSPINEVRNNSTDKIISHGYEISENDLPKPIMSFSADSANIKSIVLEGQRIELLNVLNKDKEGNLVRFIDSNEHSVWGFISKDNDLKNNYLITLGKDATSEMPASNLDDGNPVSYSGTVAHFSTQNGVKFVPGQAEFKVDFANKKLTGHITPEKGHRGIPAVIELQANISGNTFEGEANNTQTSGGFYGKDAGELIGIYSNTDENYMGAYGAKKQ